MNRNVIFCGMMFVLNGLAFLENSHSNVAFGYYIAGSIMAWFCASSYKREVNETNIILKKEA